MSDQEPLAENVEGKQTSENGQTKKKHAQIKAFIVRTRIVLGRFARRAKGYYRYYKQSDRGYYGNELRYQISDWIARRGDILRSCINWWNADRGQLLFAFILTVATIAQFIMMRNQNAIMETQMGQSETALGQTDRNLDLMKLEQRAWLSALTPDMEPFKVNEPFIGRVPILNNGQTPARMTSGSVTHFLHIDGQNISKIVEQFWKDSRRDLRHDTVAPSIGMNLNAKFDPVHTLAEQRDAITKMIDDGKITIFIVGQVTYEDIWKQPHVTQFCFTFNPKTKTYWAYGNYNHMD